MPNYAGADDQALEVRRQDFSGGINTRQAARQIGDTQCEDIVNYDISIPGEIRKDLGLTLIEDLGNDAGTGLFGFEPSGGTNVLVATHGAKLETWPGSTTFTERKTNFTTGLSTTMIKVGEDGVGDVFLVTNGTDNWFRFNPVDYSTPQDLGNTAGTGSDSPPKSDVGVYFRNRLWVMKDDLWYFSEPFPADYATTFDTVSNAFRCNTGKAKAMIALRDLGIVGLGADSVWALNPSLVPDPTTDKPEKILDIGCVAGKTAVQVGDDIVYLAKDGVRGLFRTQQDKVQSGKSYPLSYILKTQFESISWAYIEKACAIYFDNKYMIALPTNSATYNNQVWIYYPATNSWRIRDDWNVSGWATMKVNGENRLYAIDSSDGKVYRAFYGKDDNGTAIASYLVGREEDFGQPSIYKVGGELEVSALTINDDALFNIYISLDGQGFSLIGQFDAEAANAPTLPIDLPFLLGDNYTLYKKFHLEPYGRYKTIQIKMEDSINSTSEIVMYGYSLRTYPEEYENE